MRLLILLTAIVVAHPCRAQLPESQKSFDSEQYVGYQNCQKVPQCPDRSPRTSHALHNVSVAPSHSGSKQIAKAVGAQSIRRSKRCVRCHYSPEPGSAGEKAASGISCESCHGPARDWIRKHNDYGGPNATKETESSQHRQQRILAAIHHGMRHPSNLYLLARSCFTCHIVDDEDVVVAGHPAYSSGFDLVSWSQGGMRHNFYRTGGKYNAKSNANRLRVMYVVSLIAELEFSLRATSAATEREFATALGRNCIRTLRQLEQVGQATGHRAILRAAELMQGIQFRKEQLPRLTLVADQLREIGYAFAAKNDGSNLQTVDKFLPAESTYK